MSSHLVSNHSPPSRPSVSLHTLLTLDGFVADPSHPEIAKLEIEPLCQFMLERSDTLILGRPTYLDIVNAGEWPYPEHTAHVLSRHKDWALIHPSIKSSTDSLSTLLSQLEQQGMQRAWLIGGRRLVMAALADHVLDELVIHLLPITQQQGRPFFDQHHLSQFDLLDVQRLPQGIVRMQYRVSYV